MEVVWLPHIMQTKQLLFFHFFFFFFFKEIKSKRATKGYNYRSNHNNTLS